MSGNTGSSLLELFREEVRSNMQALNNGLVALEQDPSNLQQIEPLMRAAHSVKGAARVVGIDEAVKLAHAAEDCLVAAQNGRISLTPDDIDHLLTAADLLSGIAEAAGPDLPQWLAHGGTEINDLTTRLRTRAEGSAPAPAEKPAAGSRPGIDQLPRADLPKPLPPKFEQAIESAASEAFQASPMLELFRQETTSAVQSLRSHLASSTDVPFDTGRTELLMRAAHSIKGAAKVVKVELAAQLAAILEDCLVRIQKYQANLSVTSVESLRRAVDLLEAMANAVGPEFPQWVSANRQPLREIVAEVVGTQRPLAPAPPREAQPELQPTASSPAEPASEERLRTGEPQPSASKAESKPPESPAAEQVVRVTAQSLTRLMGLAGQSLVEARWLHPFSKSLLELKRRQTLLADTLEELAQYLPDDKADDRQASLAGEAMRRLEDCRELLTRQIGEFENRARNADDLNSRLYNEVIASRMRPFWDGVQGFPRMIRDLARRLGKQVAFKVRGERTEVDRDILEKLEAPLNHILRNALDHGLESPDERLEAGKGETCRLELEARHNAGMLVITVSDDGRGIDLERIRRKVAERRLADGRMVAQMSEAELLEFLFLPAFSTADGVTEVSGRGVGLDVVHSMVHSVGGSVRILTQPGSGTTFQLELPITLSVIRAVLVSIAGQPYAFPHNRIDRLVRLSRDELRSLENSQYFELDGRNVGVVLARQLLEINQGAEEEESLFLVVFSNRSDQYGLVVDEFCGESDLVVRPLDPRLGKVPNISSAAILDDGTPVLIADLDDLRRSIEKILHAGVLQRAGEVSLHHELRQTKRVLVVDDSITVREVQRQLLANQGYAVDTAVDGMEGWNLFSRSRFDLVITDIDMPRLNGIDLVRKIKSDMRLGATPVVIVSYKDREEDRLAGMEAGADYYLTKSSFHDETLLEAVRDLIGEPDS